MRRGQFTWMVVVILAIIISFVLLYPSIAFYSGDPEIIRQEDPSRFFSLKKRALKLGLDLQGGVHMVLQVRDPRGGEVSSYVQDQVLEKIRIRVDKYGITEPEIMKSGADQIVVDLPGYTDIDTAKTLIGSTAQLQFHLLRSREECEALLLAMDSVLAERLETGEEEVGEEAAATDESDTTDQALVDLFGEELADTAAAELDEEEFEKTRPFSALLDRFTGAWYEITMENFHVAQQYLEIPEVQAVIPANHTLMWGTRPERLGDRDFQTLYVLNSNIEMTGESLVSAQEAYDQLRRPVVNFELDSNGARKFASLTGKHIGEPLAIVIDGRVESAPEIQSRIAKNGQITMGGDATISEAYLLAVLLKAGSLPADVEILQSTVVGPALGKDSIQKGQTAAIIGLLLVVFFMAMYYRLSGMIADIALLLNILFVLAFMVIPGVNATLTMPGIAGIILTVGITVDSNVLIFERIREELRTGKTVRASIDAGYDRALLTIIDSHVTTLITALFLFIFGSGPVRGFAVTLSVGVFLSLFTALFITKIIFDMRKKYKRLSI
ncbi:MAG: protein translocase subunit SecD [Candidatus Zixiibacteriota bacterium]|nr:MAG: protein translocase subunit SecD [candidate division Zixibacteria bacterium]